MNFLNKNKELLSIVKGITYAEDSKVISDNKTMIMQNFEAIAE